MFRKLRLLTFLVLASFSSAIAQPVATITASPTSGCAPLGISFNGSATGTGTTTWNWTINGGSPSTSNIQNPSSIFNTPGTYNIILVATNASGTSAPASIQVTINPPPAADFTQNKTTGCYPTYIQFTNTSTPGAGATITKYSWTFGDGTQDTVANPDHRYTLAGNFPVTLYVTNSFGCLGTAQIKTVQKAIQISGGITVDFSSSLNSSCTLPVTASFANSSSGPPNLNYLWDFGDGSGTNNLQNPTHPYTVAGNYNVKLAVTSTQGCSDTLIQKVNITSNGNLTDFTYQDTVCVGTSVSFTNISSPFPVSSTWDYGDGSPIANVRNGQHTYASSGNYPVILNNTFSGCTGSITKTIYVVSPPVASFTGTNIASCKPPLTTTFTNTSTGATSWSWSFGDGSPNSSQQNPQHTYTSYSSYPVTLTASAGTGCSTTIVKPDFVTILKPIVAITGLPGYGCAPYSWTPAVSTTTADGVATYSWSFGNGNTSNAQSPPTQTYGPGVYMVYCTITTNGGCTATDSGIVKVGTIKPVPAFSFVPPAACVKSAIQFTDLTPPGTANQWLWQFGDGNTDTARNPIYKYTKPGIFNVRLTAYNNGCWDSISQTIVINPPLADFNYQTTCGVNNSFSFFDSSTGPTSWSWNFGDGGTSLIQNPTHSYVAGPPTPETVTLIVTAGTCADTVSKSIIANQSTTLSFSPTGPICVNSPVTVQAHAAVGILSFQFEMGDGTITPPNTTGVVSYTYTNPGVYQVKVITTDSKGCVDSSAAYPLNIGGPTVNFSGQPAVSCGAITISFKDLTIASAGSSLKSWAWDFGDGGTSVVENPTYTYSFQGNFQPRLTVTDNNGCTSSLDTAQPIAVSILNPSFNTVDTNSCPNAPNPVKFNNTSTGGFNPTYSWNFGDGSPADLTFSPIHNYLNVGTFTDTLTMTDSYGCTKKFGFTSILIDTPNASFTMSGNYSACPVFNDFFTFTGHYATTYAWDFNDGGISQKQNPVNGYALPGDYWPRLVVTSPGGCIALSDSQHVHIDGPVGTFSYAPPYAACDSLTVNFQVTTTNVVSFVWTPGDGSAPQTTPTPMFTYKYTKPGQWSPFVTITDAAGCKLNKIGQNLINIDSISKVNYYASKTTLCDSGNVIFTDTSILSPYTVVTNYVWDFGDGTGTITGMYPTITHDFTTVGTYTVSMSITTSGGCTGFVNYPITVAASPQVAINGILNQCEPAILTFTGTELVPDPNGPLTWSWNFGNGQTANVQNPSAVNYPKAGEYVVELTATNTKGCSMMTDTTAPNHLFIYPVPTVNAGADTTICLGTPLQLNGSGSATTYNWLPPTDPGATLSCQACANPIANPVPNSTFFVLNGTSIHGCQANDTIQVTVNVPPVVDVSGPDSVCLGQSAQLMATGASIYTWSPTEGLSNPAIGNPLATPDASQIGSQPSNVITYIVTGYDSKKCFSNVDSIQITAFNYPVITLTPNATINVGSTYQINSSVTTNIVGISWTPSNTLSCSDCLTPVATPTKTTKYSLTATNEGGCSTTDSIRVQVICDGTNFFVPNSFSPNGDGVNDRFIVNGVGLNVIPSITIYNRWGQIVFQKSNFAPNNAADAWDGTFNGQPAPSDVYIYTIQILCNNATLIPYHGNVTLIR